MPYSSQNSMQPTDHCFKVDRIGVRGRGKSCAARPREQWRHAVSEIRRTVSLKIAVKESKRQHCGDEKEAEDSQSEEEELIR